MLKKNLKTICLSIVADYQCIFWCVALQKRKEEKLLRLNVRFKFKK